MDSNLDILEAVEELLALNGLRLDAPKEEDPPSDYEEMVKKTQSSLDELQNRAEEIYERTGMNREELERFASDPKNFTSEEWESLNKVREACQKYSADTQAQMEKLVEKDLETPKNQTQNNTPTKPKKTNKKDSKVFAKKRKLWMEI